MKQSTRRTGTLVLGTALAAALLSLPPHALGAAWGSGAAAQPQTENTATSNAEARLNKKQFQNVRVKVDDGVATLTGTVALYEDKSDAEKRVLHAKGVTAVRN